MELIHRTTAAGYKGIKKKGLLKKSKAYPDIKRLALFIEPYRPKDTPSFVDVVDCIWFNPINTTYSYLPDKYLINLAVESKKLDNSKLYYIPTKIEEKIYKTTFEACNNGDKEELDRIMKSKEFIDLCKSYWEKLRPFSEYELLYGKIEELDKDINVLYFDNIPNKLIGYKIPKLPR